MVRYALFIIGRIGSMAGGGLWLTLTLTQICQAKRELSICLGYMNNDKGNVKCPCHYLNSRTVMFKHLVENHQLPLAQ